MRRRKTRQDKEEVTIVELSELGGEGKGEEKSKLKKKRNE